MREEKIHKYKQIQILNFVCMQSFYRRKKDIKYDSYLQKDCRLIRDGMRNRFSLKSSICCQKTDSGKNNNYEFQWTINHVWFWKSGKTSWRRSYMKCSTIGQDSNPWRWWKSLHNRGNVAQDNGERKYGVHLGNSY